MHVSKLTAAPDAFRATRAARLHAVESGISQDEGDVYGCTHNALLVAISQGQIDPVRLAREELASRGYDATGKWVGREADALLG